MFTQIQRRLAGGLREVWGHVPLVPPFHTPLNCNFTVNGHAVLNCRHAANIVSVSWADKSLLTTQRTVCCCNISSSCSGGYLSPVCACVCVWWNQETTGCPQGVVRPLRPAVRRQLTGIYRRLDAAVKERSQVK